jgi:hypothetical protein
MRKRREKLMNTKKVLQFAQDHRNDTETNCGACGLFFEDVEADKEGLHLPEFCAAVEFPSVQEVLAEMQKNCPEGWILSYEYPDSIGVNHPSFSNDEFIMFGDVNKHFGFNDTNAQKVCGYMETLTDPAEIVKSFWDQIEEIYPDLFIKKITMEEIIKWHEEQAREALASNEEDQWLMHLSISAKLAVSFNTYPLMNKEKN